MAAGHSVDPARWRAMFDQVMARVAGRFGRVEPRATARAYLLGCCHVGCPGGMIFGLVMVEGDRPWTVRRRTGGTGIRSG
ncbi:hypothetical protein GCM10010398_69100 [Streptomyces fimbriatus]